MANSNEYITVYEICKVLHEEEKIPYEFEEYYKIILKKVKDIFIKMGIDTNSLKTGERGSYQISINQKDEFKKIIKAYTSKPLRLIRKSEYEKLSIDELHKLVSIIDEIIKNTLSEEKYKEQLSSMYMLTRCSFLKTMEEVRTEGIGRIISDIESIKPLLLDMTLNETDKICLLEYYIKLIHNISSHWKRIVENFSYIRLEEIEEISLINMDKEEELSNTEFFSMITDPKTALFHAIVRSIEDIEIKETALTPPDKQEMERVGNILQMIRNERFKIKSK